MTLPLIVLTVAVVLVAVLFWLLRPGAWVGPPVRVEECDTCGEPVAMDVAHVLADVEHDAESGGGTAMVATYCADDCPGGCNRHHERTSA